MRVDGFWSVCDDGVVRPVLQGELQAADGSWVVAEFLVDTEADRTVICAAVAAKLGLPSLASAQLGGVGGSATTVQFDILGEPRGWGEVSRPGPVRRTAGLQTTRRPAVGPGARSGDLAPTEGSLGGRVVMPDVESGPWQPTVILRVIKSLPTAAATVLVRTDKGNGYLKAMGNPEGPHTLASEWIGTQLARRLGLPTFDFALVTVTKDDEIPFAKGGGAEPGPAFITREERGIPWGGGQASLRRLTNPADLTRLVLLDTWLRNCDRHPHAGSSRKPNRDNVFLSRAGAPPRKFLVKAMDHTHCFTCGRALTPSIADISCVKEDGCYGLFPEFWPHLDREVMRSAAGALRDIAREELRGVVESIPGEWEVTRATRDALADFLARRAEYVADRIETWLWPQREIEFPAGEGETT